jgi:hypothetical protein
MSGSYQSHLDEAPKSPHVVFRLYTALFMFDQIFNTIPAHAIALTRNLILTMKTTFIKSLQDYDRLSNCKECDPSQVAKLRNDLISLIAFPEFVSSVLDTNALERGPGALVTSFNNYLDENIEYLFKKLSAYTS